MIEASDLPGMAEGVSYARSSSLGDWHQSRRSGSGFFLHPAAGLNAPAAARTFSPWHVICNSPLTRTTRVPASSTVQFATEENVMGKYVLAWLLGVPMFVLVIVYIFFH